MKKFLSVLTIAALLVTFALPAMAEQRENTEKMVFVNTTEGAKQFTAVTTTYNAQQQNAYIKPGKHRIISFSVSDIGGGVSASTEAVAALYDAASVGAATNQFIEGEIESSNGNTEKHKYDKPLKLSNGLVIGQGSLSCVVLEYERYTP